MKNVFLIFATCLLALGCSDDITTNTPVIQGSVNSQFFRAPQASATLNADGSVKLIGTNDTRTITLQTASAEIGTYPLIELPNEATFLTFDQELYVAGNGLGDGMIEITKNTGTELWGAFYFNAIGDSGDTLNFQKGVFFGVPIVNGTPTENEGDTFTAEIDGTNFTATIKEATVSADVITASGANETTTITLKFPVNITTGQYTLSASGTYTAQYVVNGVSEAAATGALDIISNDTTAKVVKGTFEFTTDVSGTVITNGAFELTYQ
ncbi:MAG TPA: DUF6252 family protein [Flavobacteriaceae bacterium]|nr:DUF6252 family protein [Flavobacteriaceae bacterium]